jgi:hypothetical protein
MLYVTSKNKLAWSNAQLCRSPLNTPSVDSQFNGIGLFLA